jgi:succinate dehydrogenase/fumarate reductase flavoprotein subunit
METDVVVVGSGCSGLTAAITAAKGGLDVILVEKSEYFGGTTAWSGGGLWIPGNSLAAQQGYGDSAEQAAIYLHNLVGDIIHEDILSSFLSNGPKMVDFLCANTDVELALQHGEGDYYQELEGAAMDGRLLGTLPYDGRKLGAYLTQIRPPLQEFNAPFGFMVGFPDLPHLLNVGKSFASTAHVAKMVLRYGRDRIRHPRGTALTMGNALVARLLKSALTAGVTLWREAPMRRLLVEAGRVVGVEVQHDGQDESIRVRKGVVLASGGFHSNVEMRREFIPYPEQHVSMMPDTNVGDGLAAAQAAGAELDLGNHANASYAIVSVLHKKDGTLGKYPHVFLDRPKPGYIAVNENGERFGNEAAANLVEAMHTTGAVPAHLLCDHTSIKKYGLGLVYPGGIRLKSLVKAGYIIKGETLDELAEKIGVNPTNLRETVEKFNRNAELGHDPDFGKGDSEVDRALGDPKHTPNPCLGPIETAPFYAVQIFPGGASTMLGLKVNGDAQVLHKDSGDAIPGLYACGVDMNALWRGREPSHGSYLALGMTFGYVAANSIIDSDA